MTVKETRKVDEPKFYEWWSYLLRQWEPSADVKSFVSLTGFAFAMASFAQHSNPVCVGLPKLAARAHMSERQARRWQQQCIDAGLFVVTGQSEDGSKPVLRRSLPGSARDKSVRSFDKSVTSFDKSVTDDPEISALAEVGTSRSEAVRFDKSVTSFAGNNRVNSSDNNRGEPVSVFADDKSLTELVAEARDWFALDSLRNAHESEWTAELSELAAARKAELAADAIRKAELAEAADATAQAEPSSLATDSSFDEDDASEDYETVIVSERFMSSGKLSYRPSLNPL